MDSERLVFGLSNISIRLHKFSSKDKSSLFEVSNTKEPFIEKFLSYDIVPPSQYFTGGFEIYVDDPYIEIDGAEVENPEYSEKGEKAGEFSFHAYNLTEFGCDFDLKELYPRELEDNFMKLFEVMESINSDQGLYFQAFIEYAFDICNKIDTPLFLKMCNKGSDFWLITLDRFYINKKYRHKGISKFLHTYMYDIIKSYFDITPLFMCGALVPDTEKDVDEQKMIESQKKAYKSKKYCEVGLLGSQYFFCQLLYPIEELK